MSSSSSSSSPPPSPLNTDDPASLLRKVVKIHSLSSKPELNNKFATVTSFSTERNRYLVELYPPSSPPSSSTISIRAENLSVASWKDKAQIKLEMYKSQVHTLYHDPQIRQQVQSLYVMMDRQLPMVGSSFKIHPEHVLIGSILFFIMMIWLLGINKSILILSLASITFMVVIQDIVQAFSSSRQGRPSIKVLFKTIVQNFPMRWRNVIGQSLGWPTISQRFALALWFGLVFFMLTVLLKSNPTTSKGKQYSTSTSTSQYTHPSSNSILESPSWTLEDLYERGFDDANKKRTFGTSLPLDVQEYMILLRSSSSSTDDKYQQHQHNTPIHPSSTMSQDIYEDSSYPSMDYIIPPPRTNTYTRTKRSSPKLGYTTIAAFYSLFRVIRELGFHNGKLDLSLLIANLKNLQPWRLGLIGLSLYKVISIFF